MTIVDKIYTAADVDRKLSTYRSDTLTLTFEERRHGHGKRKSDGGLEFAMSLPGGTILKDGDRLVLDPDETIISIREAEEPVYVVKPKTPQEWAFYAYHVGNRHQQVMIGETELIFPQNPAVRSLLEQLHASFDTDRRCFTAALATVGHSH
jgi:urease accessory protein